MIGKRFEAIAIDVDGAGILAGEKASATWRTDRALAIGMGEGDTFSHEAVDVRGGDVRVTERTDGVKALLVGTDPKDVGLDHDEW